MKLKAFIYFFSFTLFGSTVFGQLIRTNKKGRYEILESPDNYIIHTGYGWICSIGHEPFLEKRKIDSLQTKLDNINMSTRDKEYVYIMKVYSDYSYELEKEYRFHFNISDETQGTIISGEEYRRFPDN